MRECPPGTDLCQVDRDCDGDWSACSSECTRTWSETTSHSGKGVPCPNPKAPPVCTAGLDACPVPAVIPCVGSWQPAICQKSCGSLTYSVSQKAKNGGDACDYSAGDTQECLGGYDDCEHDYDCKGVCF